MRSVVLRGRIAHGESAFRVRAKRDPEVMSPIGARDFRVVLVPPLSGIALSAYLDRVQSTHGFATATEQFIKSYAEEVLRTTEMHNQPTLPRRNGDRRMLLRGVTGRVA